MIARVAALLAVVALGLIDPMAPRASAQWRPWTREPDTYAVTPPPSSDAWAASVAPPTGAINPAHQQRPAYGAIAIGVVPLALGWAASIGIGVGVHASTTLDGSGCAEEYANLHFLPLVGSIAGLASTFGCAGLHLGYSLLDLLTSMIQVAGTTLFIVGLNRHDRVLALEGPGELELTILPWANEQSAGLTAEGSF